MTITETTPTVRNGVPVDKLFATIDKVRGEPSLAAFEFTGHTSWIEGTSTMTSFPEWYGAGANHEHVAAFTATADHPTLGNGHGPTPQEYVLHALAACVAAGIATTAAARKVELRHLRATVRGSQDVRGVLGIDSSVRNGFSTVTLEVEISGDAPAEVLERIVEGSRTHSAVFDMLTAETPVEVSTTVND